MRRFPRLSFFHLAILVTTSLVFTQGCTRPVLQTYPAGIQESEAVLKAFARYQETRDNLCPCCLDAEADAAVSVSGWFNEYTGKLSGYLQAMEPGHIKFVAINPLGQPLVIFVTNGKVFKSLNVFEGQAYVGSVYSETYRKFAPPGFAPEFSYYWLTGRVPPENLQISEVLHDRGGDAFWLQIKHADGKTDSMVLFDPEDQVIWRHVLRDGQGKHLVDIIYADYQVLPETAGSYSTADSGTIPLAEAEREQCRLPARITVSFRAGAETIEVKLFSFLAGAHFSAADFHLVIPENFNQQLVQ